MTPLHIASANNDYQMIKLLLDNGANVKKKDKFGRTPFLLAIKNGNLKIASLLVRFGSDFR